VVRFSIARIARLIAGAGVAILGAFRLRRPPQTKTSPPKAEPDDLERLTPAAPDPPAQLLSEARYRTPADQVINYAIFMVNRQGRHATWNKGVARMLGYAMDEFLGNPIADLYTPEDQAADLPARLLAEATDQGRAARERWVVRKDGSRFWAATATTAARDSKGQVIGFAQTLRDLTDLRRAEEELRRSREALDFALEAAALGTWDQDLVTGELQWDSRAKALFGLSPDTPMSHRRWADSVHPDDLPVAEAARDRAVRDRTPLSVEYRVVWPEGSELSSSMVGRATVDPATGHPVRMAGAMLDITERKRTEARLQEVLRLEAIGRLAGGIAHDLNNMLVAILGFSDLLAGSFQPEDPRREDVEQITLAASRSANLTRQLLAFARREIIQPRRIDLNGVVQRAERLVRPVLGENVEMSFQLSTDVGAIYADPAQVEQILMNLVLNARDAMPQGGRVQIETATLTLGGALSGRDVESEAGPGRYVMLAVSDTGQGMDPATLQRIWEPFFTTKPVGRGTGLGLAAVYGAVKQSGGFVWAESAPGQGTVISVYWPEDLLKAEQLTDAGALLRAEHGSETVLVVEDEPLVRSLTVRTLGRLGYRCFVAERAEHALRMVRDREVIPDLVISDVVLPGKSGGWLAEQLSLDLPGLPILFMSGFTDEEVMRRGLLAAGRPFLQKPFAPGELAREVRRVLDLGSSLLLHRLGAAGE
jgi:two-component system, cell cycle sensor histidine kinase and response regulator CckA